MCWSLQASVALAATGAGATVYGVRTDQPRELVVGMGYFSVMETLQAITYFVIDQCGLPLNELLTVISYIHIAFQPFVINLIMMHFIPAKRRQKIAIPVYAVCTVASATLLLQLYPFSWAGSCMPGSELCGRELCSYTGIWHLAWDIPLNGLANSLLVSNLLTPFLSLPGYFIAGILLPFLYGSWRANVYHIIAGPLLAIFLVHNYNEAGAIWCTFSVALIISLLGKKPIRQFLYVQ